MIPTVPAPGIAHFFEDPSVPVLPSSFLDPHICEPMNDPESSLEFYHPDIRNTPGCHQHVQALPDHPVKVRQLRWSLHQAPFEEQPAAIPGRHLPLVLVNFH